MAEYIKREAVKREFEEDGHLSAYVEEMIDSVPAADVVPREQYTKLLKAAFAMHEWIFLNTDDEKTAYAECGLDDETNALLGYGGSVTITGGADHE